MATPTPRKQSRSAPSSASLQPVEVVDPRWLLKAGGLTIGGALICGYLTLCLLVYLGQWQLVLHPDLTHPAPVGGLSTQVIPFGAAESGQPRLSGWWIPAEPGPRNSETILYLHDGTGNLAAQGIALASLHGTGVNLFAFDYRGFGASDPAHPTEEKMSEDAAAALDYLVNTRHLPIKTIVPYGAGLGGSLALHLAAAHPDLPAVIVESPNPDVLALVQADPRTSLVPLGLLFHERFEVESTIATLKTPKLLLAGGPSVLSTAPGPRALDTLYASAATPSRIVHLTSSHDPAFAEALTRFLDEYAPAGPAPLKP